MEQKPADSIHPRARKVFDQGMAAACRQEWMAGSRYFQQAFQLRPWPEQPPALLLNSIRQGNALTDGGTKSCACLNRREEEVISQTGAEEVQDEAVICFFCFSITVVSGIGVKRVGRGA